MTLRFLVLSFLLPVFSFCQKTHLSIGAFAGPNLTSLTWPYTQSIKGAHYTSGPGYQAGLHAEWYVLPAVVLRAEVTYQAIGTRLIQITYEAPNSSREEQISNLFITTCAGILGKALLSKKPNHFYVLTGPTFEKLIKGNRRIKNGSESGATLREDLDLKENAIRQNQWMVDAGLGYAFRCGRNGQLAAEFRYQHALAPFSKMPGINAHHATARLSVVYSSPL